MFFAVLLAIAQNWKQTKCASLHWVIGERGCDIATQWNRINNKRNKLLIPTATWSDARTFH